MKIIKVNDINIIFNSSNKTKAQELKKIIENNKMLFQEMLSNKIYSFIKDIPNTIYIENIDDFIKQIVDINFYSEELEKRFENHNQLITIYLGYIIVESLTTDKIKDLYATDKDIANTKSTLSDSLYQKEIYEDLLIKDYFDKHGTKKDFIEYIKTKQNKEELISKIKDIYRFDTYNLMLENIVEYLKECGYFEPENMLEICGNILFKMRELTILKFINEEELNEKLKALPQMNKLNLDKYFREFLKEINPEGILLKIYNEALSKNKIKIDKNYQSSNCIVENNEATLEIQETNTLEDFFTLSHEFMHYVMYTYNKESIPYSLEEFPSIFLEKYAIDFLEKKGYSKEQLEVLHDFRIYDMKEKSFGFLNFILADIIDKSKGRYVDDTRLREFVTGVNKIIEQRNEKIRNIYGTKEDGSDYLNTYDVEEYIKKDIDERTKSYFLGLIQYVEAFRYPISSYVAFHTYDKMRENSELLNEVINFSLYAKNPSFTDTLEQFGLTEDYQNLLKNIEKDYKKEYIKDNK